MNRQRIWYRNYPIRLHPYTTSKENTKTGQNQGKNQSKHLSHSLEKVNTHPLMHHLISLCNELSQVLSSRDEISQDE
jgi:hypothetical protein